MDTNKTPYCDCPVHAAQDVYGVIASADKATLIAAIRAFITAKLWNIDAEELRESLRVGLLDKDFTAEEVVNALTRGA